MQMEFLLQHLWPVLGCIVAPSFSDVLLVGICWGNIGPAEFGEISVDIIYELKEMTDMGLFSVKFNKYIALKLVTVVYRRIMQ